MRSARRLLRSVLSRSADQMLQRLLPRLAPAQLDRLLEQVAVELEAKTKMSLTYHKRPLLAEGVDTWSDPLIQDPAFALVVQGPIIKENDFTLNSIRIYKKNFHNTHIILSTWDDEDESNVSSIRAEGIHILRNPKPEYPGVSNINYQIVSAFAGVQQAEQLGAEYVLKTRTDQRLYAPNIAEFLCNLLNVFPVAQGYIQRQRIVGVNLNTFKYRHYGLSDMTLFGHVEDMLKYWGCALDQRRFTEYDYAETSKSMQNYAKWCVCEIYLATQFLTAVGRNLRWTLQDSWQAFADHFIVINKEDIDLFWPKYTHRENRWLRYDGIIGCQELSFREWLNLYAGLCAKICIDDAALDIPFTNPVPRSIFRQDTA